MDKHLITNEVKQKGIKSKCTHTIHNINRFEPLGSPDINQCEISQPKKVTITQINATNKRITLSNLVLILKAQPYDNLSGEVYHNTK